MGPHNGQQPPGQHRLPPPNDGLVGIIPGTAETLRVREVWQDNLEEELIFIRNVVDQFPFIAMDTEFPGVVAKPVPATFKSGKERQEWNYKGMKMNVDMLKIIQLGLTFTDSAGNLPLWGGERCVWQFNFKGFRLSDDVYNQDSIELLTKSGIDFQQHEQRGIDVFRFGELLMSSGIVLNEDITWVTFHSGYDFGYLLKILTCQPLPSTEDEFFELLRLYFPNIVDVKYLLKQPVCGGGLHGGLRRLSEQLEVQRIGPEHQAGSDSLLTLQVFLKVAHKYFRGIEGIARHQGVLYGMGIDMVQWDQKGPQDNGQGLRQRDISKMSAVAASAAALALYYFLRNQRANVFSACGASPVTTAPVQQEFGRHVEHAPRTWFEALEVLKEVLRMMYTETLGRWHTVDLFVGLAYLSNKEQLQFAASDIAAKGSPVNLQAPVEDCEALKVQLQEIRQYMLYCQGLKFKKAETQARFWIDNAGISPKQILVQQATAGLLRPAYVIIRDDVLRKVVLCIRGTKSMKDLFTSLSGATKPHHAVTPKGVTLGYGHLGMLAAARWLQRQVTPLLKEALEESGPDYTACIVGHSMGAGTAVMLTMMIRDVCPELSHVTCVAIACPACMTEELARSCKSFVTSVINGTDIVPTFCAASIDALREDVTASSWFAEFQKDLRASVVRAVSGGMRGIGSATQWTARNILSPAAYPLASCYTRTTATCRPVRVPVPGTSYINTPSGAVPDHLIGQHQEPAPDMTDMLNNAGPDPMTTPETNEQDIIVAGHSSRISQETLEATLRSCLHAAQREVHVPGTAVPEMVTEPLGGFTSTQAAEMLLGNELSEGGPSSRAGRNKAPRPNAPPLSPFQTSGQPHSHHDHSPAHGSSSHITSSPNRWWPWQQKQAQVPFAEPLLAGSYGQAQTPRVDTRNPEADAGRRQGGFLGFLPNIFGGWNSPTGSPASQLPHGRVETQHRRSVSEFGTAHSGPLKQAQKQTTYVSTAGAGQQASRSWLINAMFAACMVPNRHRTGEPLFRKLGAHSRNPSLVDSLQAAGSPAGRPASLIAEESSDEDDEEVILGDTDISGLSAGHPSEQDQQSGLASRGSLQDQLQAGITAVVAAVTNEAENNWEDDEEEGGELVQEAEAVLQETDMQEMGNQPTTAISPAGIPTGHMSDDVSHQMPEHAVESNPHFEAGNHSRNNQRHVTTETTNQPEKLLQQETLLGNGANFESVMHTNDSITQPASALQPGVMDVSVDGYVLQAPATLPNQASNRTGAAGLLPGAGSNAAPQTVHRKLFPAGRILHFVPQHAMDALKAQNAQPQDDSSSNQEDTSQVMSAPQPADLHETHRPSTEPHHDNTPYSSAVNSNQGHNASSDVDAQPSLSRLQASATQPALKQGDVVGAVGKIPASAQGPWVLLEVEDPTVYCRVKLCKTMVMDHFVSSYITALDSVVSQLDAHIETVSK